VTDADLNRQAISSAANDFRRARWQAVVEELVARLQGKSVDLLSYEDIIKKLKVKGQASRGRKEIPLDAIVGSVGRVTEFTRSFLPRRDKTMSRWSRVGAAVSSMEGVPPIEVYKVGDAYFVLDGNHRVSVARQMGSKYIEAYVTEVKTRVPLTSDIQPEQLIAKAEYADFLVKTRLDELRPDASMEVSAAGQYPKLEEHIEVHKYFMGLEQQRDIPYAEAVEDWYDTVYVPVVDVIREMKLSEAFPNLTETDLYLLFMEHWSQLTTELGWNVDYETAAENMARSMGTSTGSVLSRWGSRILDVVVPEELEDGPASGEWRQRLNGHADHIFTDVLVSVSGQVNSWNAVAQAMEVVQRESGRLLGLHVTPAHDLINEDAAQAVRGEFERRCHEAQIRGEMVLTSGQIANEIVERTRWADLVVVNVAYPPTPQPLLRLLSGFRALIRRSHCPVLAVPRKPSCMKRALLAFDGSPKAREAMFVAAYMAQHWGTELTVVSVIESMYTTPDTLVVAREYLEAHGVQATYVQETGVAAEGILKTRRAHNNDLIIMGGYGFSPVFEAVWGSAIDQVLRETHRPVLICR
jgi:nucleotide-binding universal stress UspA family protein